MPVLPGSISLYTKLEANGTRKCAATTAAAACSVLRFIKRLEGDVALDIVDSHAAPNALNTVNHDYEEGSRVLFDCDIFDYLLTIKAQT